MGPRAHGPSDGGGGSARREVDAGWDDVLVPGPSTPAAAPEEPRAATEEAAADAGPRVAESSSVDLSTATLEQDATEPDDEVDRAPPDEAMEAMMSGSWGMATRDASGPVSIAPLVAPERTLRESEAEMAALMGARETLAAESVVAKPSRTVIVTHASPRSEPPTEPGVPELIDPIEPSVREAGVPEPIEAIESLGRPVAPTAIDPVRESTEVLMEPSSTRPKTGPMGVVRPVAAAPRRMPSPEPRRIASRSSDPGFDLGSKPKRLSLGWAVVAGVGIAGVAWAIGGPMGSKATNDPPSAKKAVVDAKSVGSREPVASKTPPEPAIPASTSREPIEPELPKPEPKLLPEPEPALVPKVVPVPESKVEPKPEPAPKVDPTPKVAPSKPVATPSAKPTSGVRTPPPGTPPDIAATFVRLPVSAADLPPVGGVGASGIHVDRVDMGSGYDNKTGCTGVASEFSLAGNDEINVCVRVVHPRQDEVMSIVWQKSDGSTARRGKIAVKPIHAYRTRAYLRLRAEYIGAWTVRIMSPDGVELASHAFKITP